MAETISIQVCELQPGDRVLGLQVIKAKRHNAWFTRVELENGTSLPLESAGLITVTREMETE
jgi:hypothetical protein